MSRHTGSAGWLLFLWLLSGVITLIAALCYGELAGMMPQAGGQFVYIRRAWGNCLAFLYGWTVFMVIQTGVIAAVAVAFAKFTAVFFPYFNTGNILFQAGGISISAAQMLAIFLIAVLTWFNSYGIEGGKTIQNIFTEGGKTIQNIFTSAKLLALFILIVAGLWVGLKTNTLSANFDNAWSVNSMIKTDCVNSMIKTDSSWIEQHISGFAIILMLGTAIIGSLFSSDAWNNVTFIAGEIKDPSRNIPRSLMLGTAMVTLLYCLANIAYLALLPLKGSIDAATVAGQGIQFAGGDTDRVGTAAASMIFGDSSVYIMAALIMISTFRTHHDFNLRMQQRYYLKRCQSLLCNGIGESIF